MMNFFFKHFTFFVLVVSCPYSACIAQKINYGFGLSHQSNSFQYDDNDQFDNASFQAAWSHNIGFQVFFDWQAVKQFELRLLTNFHSRAIRLAVQVPDRETTAQDGSLSLFYNTTEIRLLGRYLFERGKWRLYPELGAGIGFHTPNGNGTSTGGIAVEQVPLNLNENEKRFTNVGVIVGVSIQPPVFIFDRRIEFNLSGFFSPILFLDHPLIIESDNQDISVQGKYHYISVGLDYFINKMKH